MLSIKNIEQKIKMSLQWPQVELKLCNYFVARATFTIYEGLAYDIYFSIISVVGCRSNNDCADKQACSNKECIDPCAAKQCGRTQRKESSGHQCKCFDCK